MRRRITRTLYAAAAAGVSVATLGLSAAGTASAATTAPAAAASHITQRPSGGPPIYTPPCSSFQDIFDNGGCAGYVASGRNFRYAQAVITTPRGNLPANEPLAFVTLGSGDNVAAAGIGTCAVINNLLSGAPCTGTYGAIGLVAHQGTILFTHVYGIVNLTAGQGVFFSIYYNQEGNELHFVINAPVPGGYHAFSFGAHGAVYDFAAALDDYSASAMSTPGPRPIQDFRVNQFFQGRFTTGNGDRGTFWGPWNLNPVEITSPDGLAPPANQLTVDPSYLWNDGNSLNGMWGDAFGVWWRHNA